MNMAEDAFSGSFDALSVARVAGFFTLAQDDSCYRHAGRVGFDDAFSTPFLSCTLRFAARGPTPRHTKRVSGTPACGSEE